MKNVFVVLVAVIVSLLFMNIVLAEGINLKPGKWEFKTTINSPMMPDAQVRTDTRCITVEEVNGDPLATLVEKGGCKILDKKKSGNTIEFEVECEGGMGNKVRGKGHFTANGTTATGKMEMTMNMGGQSMTMKQAWDGKRIGKCD